MKISENIRNLIEKDNDTIRFLGKFKKELYPGYWIYDNKEVRSSEVGKKIVKIGDEIVEKLKAQELTYVDAYITLEYVYRKLRFNSEYTHL